MSIFNKKGALHAKDYLYVLSRRWKLMLASFLFCLMASIYVNLTITPVYKAAATLLVQPEISQSLLGPVNKYVAEINEDMSIETHLLILRSDPVAEGVVRRLNFIDEEKDPYAFRGFAQRIKSMLWVERVGSTRLLKINAFWEKGVMAADIANAAAAVFIEQNLQNKFEASKKSIGWLTEHIITTRKKLEESELSLVDYQRKEKIASGNVDKSFQSQKISEIQNQFIDSQRSERELKEKLDKINRLLKKDKIRFVPENLTSSLDSLGRELTVAELNLQKSGLEYKSKHPKIIRIQGEIDIIESQVRNELRKAIENLNSEYQINMARRKILSESLDFLNQSTWEGKEKHIQLMILKREVETYSELYNILIKKLKAMDLIRGVGESNIRIIESAKAPSAPVRPRKRRNLFFGIVVGLTVSLGFALILEYFDRTIRTPDDLEEALDIPILGSVPKVRKKEQTLDHHGILLTQVHQQSFETTAFQALRTALRFCQSSKPPYTYLVTSTSPSEGKTTISINLGMSMAFSGSKTLIVDTDLRRPKVHMVFERPNDRGVTNCDPEDIQKSIQKTDHSNLDILTSGPHISNIFELLESTKMKTIVEKLKQHYDHIIFDSPPVGSVVDACVLSTYVNGVIFVLKSGKIESLHVKHARDQLDKVHAKIFGVVLNKLDAHSSRYFYNYYYYYRGYYGDRAKEILQGIKDSVQKL